MKKMIAMILMVTMLVSMNCVLAEEVIEEAPVCEVVETPAPVEEEKVEATVEEKTEVVEEKPEIVEEIPEDETVIEEIEVREEDFSADVVLTLVNDGQLYYGDVVTFSVHVSNATAEYVINWQYCDGGEWKNIGNEHGTSYSFELNEINAGYGYRVALEKI